MKVAGWRGEEVAGRKNKIQQNYQNNCIYQIFCVPLQSAIEQTEEAVLGRVAGSVLAVVETVTKIRNYEKQRRRVFG